MSKFAFRAQTVDIACLPLRQDFLAKDVLMTAQRDFGLSNSLSDPDCEHLAGDIKISLFLPVLSRYESELL
jgi:hypothetical protein